MEFCGDHDIVTLVGFLGRWRSTHDQVCYWTAATRCLPADLQMPLSVAIWAMLWGAGKAHPNGISESGAQTNPGVLAPRNPLLPTLITEHNTRDR